MKHMESDAFVRLIAYQHTVGTMEYIAMQDAEDGVPGGFRFTITSPDKAALKLSVDLEASVLNPTIDALLDLKDVQEQMAWREAGSP